MQKNNEILQQWLQEQGVSLIGFADLHGVDAAEKQNMPYGVCLAVCPWTKNICKDSRQTKAP